MEPFLLLIDGSSLLSTQFFGNLPREIMYAKTMEEKEKYFHKIMMTSQGVYTNAIFGFMRTLIRIIKDQKPAYLAVAWDLTRDTFRRELYPEYKGNRGETMEPLKRQFALCQQILEEIGVVQLKDPYFEADDFCGTLAARFEKDIPVRLLTKDHDYLQLVTEQTNLWMMQSDADKADALFAKYKIDKSLQNVPEKVFNFTPKLVEEEFGVKPCHINSLKGLMGDSSDNIKGVPGIGQDTAVKLIQEYGTVENLYHAMEGMDKDKEKQLKAYWKEKLGLKRSPLSYLLKESDTELVGKKAAFLSEELATIRKDAPTALSLEDLRLAVDAEKMQAVFERLEFRSLKADFGEEKETLIPVESGKVIDDFSEAYVFIEQMKKENALGLYLAYEDERLYGAAFCAEGKSAWLPVQNFVTQEQLTDWLKDLLENGEKIYAADVKKIYHILHPEYRNSYQDVQVMAYLLEPLNAVYPVETIAKTYLDWQIKGYADIFGKEKMQESTEKAAFVSFACQQAAVALYSGPVMQKQLKEENQLRLYEEVEMPLVYDLYCMEKEGILVKRDALTQYGEDLKGGIAQLESKIHELAGEKFNILSPKQLGEILFEKMKLPYAKKTKTGYSTSADVLEKLSTDYPIANMILQYRQLTKLKSTYAEGLASCIAKDGRIHGTFNQTITATGRISSTEPNLQNIPVRMELGRAIRKVFVPKDGWIFLDADYSQIELRVLAHMSEDKNLIQAYQNAQDIHTMTASLVFHVPLDEVTPMQRRNAKAVNFGIVYGISAFGLSEDLSISRKEASEYINRYFETYPGIKDFLDRMVEEGREKEYVTTMFGRRRPIPELKSSNYMQRQFGERVAMNSPIQGTAADIMKIAMLHVNRRLKNEGCKAKIVLQVHDELLLETPIEEKEKVSRILREEMQNAVSLSVPLEVSLSEGASWYETK